MKIFKKIVVGVLVICVLLPSLQATLPFVLQNPQRQESVPFLTQSERVASKQYETTPPQQLMDYFLGRFSDRTAGGQGERSASIFLRSWLTGLDFVTKEQSFDAYYASQNIVGKLGQSKKRVVVCANYANL
ncbi:MAG: hypothetical protein FWD76_04780, partial [Firmicutes bacterium]|nr:hypothetical protein [Bacillota bacterium]